MKSDFKKSILKLQDLEFILDYDEEIFLEVSDFKSVKDENS